MLHNCIIHVIYHTDFQQFKNNKWIKKLTKFCFCLQHVAVYKFVLIGWLPVISGLKNKNRCFLINVSLLVLLVSHCMAQYLTCLTLAQVSMKFLLCIVYAVCIHSTVCAITAMAQQAGSILNWLNGSGWFLLGRLILHCFISEFGFLQK